MKYYITYGVGGTPKIETKDKTESTQTGILSIDGPYLKELPLIEALKLKSTVKYQLFDFGREIKGFKVTTRYKIQGEKPHSDLFITYPKTYLQQEEHFASMVDKLSDRNWSYNDRTSTLESFHKSID